MIRKKSHFFFYMKGYEPASNCLSEQCFLSRSLWDSSLNHQEMPALSPPSQFRSEKLELSEDFATEAACRMKQFEDDEEEKSRTETLRSGSCNMWFLHFEL